MNDTMHLWLLARTSGVLAYLLLTSGVIAGLTLKSRMFGRAVPPALITVVHQTLSTLGIVAVVVHVALLVLDTKVDIPLIAAFVPGTSGYRMIATAIGVVALELWVIIHLSFSVRRYIGVKRWRSLHRVTFAVWGLAAIHGIAAGSDSGLAWAQNMYAISAALVVGLIGWRVLSVRSPRSAPQVASQPTTR